MIYVSPVLIADGKANGNGRKYKMKDVKFPNEALLYDSAPGFPEEQPTPKVIGRTELYAEKDVIYGKCTITDPAIVDLLRAEKKLFVVSCGIGDFENSDRTVKNFKLQSTFITDQPSDDRLTPLKPE